MSLSWKGQIAADIIDCPSCLSQSKQDLILQRIFETIGTTNKKCVEFGFGYSKEAQNMEIADFMPNGTHRGKIMTGLNTHNLIRDGWHPTYFDTEFSNSKINLFKATLTEDTIARTFQDANIPLDVDYVSIDVDSVDVWLLQGLLKGGYRPRVLSVEFNINWMAHMPVTCRREWAPWKDGSRIYGSSAAAINIVAELYGYKVVELMANGVDLFLIRKDILEETCSNFNDLPTFESMTEGIIGRPMHNTCDKNEAAQRLVDFPLAMAGKDEEASKKAMDYVRELNEAWTKQNKKPFCQLD